MNMKKTLLILAAAFAFAACSDDENPNVCPTTPAEVISFEAAEGMKDISGAHVVLGDITVSGGVTAGVYHNVFWAKGGSYDALAVDGIYNGVLCTTADGKTAFGTYFSPDSWGDSWGGFVMTANYSRSITTFDWVNQFTVWTSKGAGDSSNCLIGYCNDFSADDQGYAYARPTIEFASARKLCHLYMANTAMTYTYAATAVAAKDYYYKVIVTGYLGSTKTGSVTCALVSGSSKVSDWKLVKLSALGKVDRIEFTADSNDVSGGFLNAPAYFAIDAIGIAE